MMLFKVTLKLEGHKIPMIKLVRFASHLGLREAKDFVETHLNSQGNTVIIAVPNPAKVFEALCSYDASRYIQSPVWSDLVRIEPFVNPVPVLTTIE